MHEGFKYRPEIDGLRAVAVLSVFLFHLGFSAFGGGYVGVDVFFVISGYLITSIIQKDINKDEFSIVKFYDRRFRRIMPALYLLLIFTTIFTWFYFMPQEMKSYCRSLLSSLLFYSNFLFWKEAGYFDLDSAMKPLLHTWSLSIEEQFYIFYPTLLYLLNRFLKSKKILIIGLLFWISFGCNIAVTDAKSDMGFYFTPTRVWELLLGALIALKAFPQNKNHTINEVLCWSGLGMLIYSIFGFNAETTFPGINAAIPCFGTALLIYGNQGLGLTSAGKLLATDIMTWVGKISYSLYLWHWPAIVFAKYYLMRDLGWLDQMLIFIGATLAAFLSWKYIEQPFREKKGFFKNGKRLFQILVALTLLFCLFAFFGGYYKKIGYLRRLSKDVKAYSQSYKDTNPDRNRCHQGASESFKESEICHIGATDQQPSFAVWGDSFADAMMPAVKSLAVQYNKLSIYSSSSACAPSLGIDRKVNGIHLSCNNFNQIMIDTIKKNQIKHVLLISAWSIPGYRISNGQKEDPIIDPVFQNIKVDKNEDESFKKFVYGIDRLLKELQPMGVKVWVVRRTPIPDFDVPSYLGRYQLLGRDPKLLEKPAQIYAEIARPSNQMWDEFAKKYNVGLIDPSQVLCAEKCKLELDGKSLYSDHTHLSKTGVMYVKDTLIPFFDSLGKK